MRIEKKQSLNGLDLKQNKNFSRMGEEKTRFIENAVYCIFKGRFVLIALRLKSARELSEQQHVVYKLERDFTKEEFYSHFGEGSTFPQVTLEDKKLGGCIEQTVKYLRENNVI